MTNPIMMLPDALQKALALVATAKADGLPEQLFTMVHLRASQINGCSFCVNMHAKELKKAGETDERIYAVSAWLDSPLFSDAERAVLALTEAATRLADRTDAVPDGVWKDAAQHFDEKQLAAIVMHIAMINFWNRLNVTTRQVAGSWPA
jgi:AhpD family alkylhydroperoxidase